MSDMKVVVRSLSHWFTRGKNRFEAIVDINLDVPAEQIVAIIGRTGCGKSTLFNILLGLIPPSRGEVLIDGRNPFTEFLRFRGRITAVFQTPRLLPWRTAEANACLGLEILQGRRTEESRQVVREWFVRLGLAGAEEAYPHQLSGGMQQRVGIARAFSTNPDILLCDEAFGHLDEVTAIQLRTDFVKLIRETGKTCLFITHGIEEAFDVADRYVVLGKPARVLLDWSRPKELDVATRVRLKNDILAALQVNE